MKHTQTTTCKAAIYLALCISAGAVALAMLQVNSVAAQSKPAPVSVLCDYAVNIFNATPSVNATSSAKWSCTDTLRLLVANGLPDHEVGTFPNRNNPPAIAAQNVRASMPLNPVLTAVATTRGGPRADAGFLLNGVKIDPSTAGTCDANGTSCAMARGTGPWSLEAMGQKTFNFGTDNNNAHVQPSGAYHYHGIPEGYLAKMGKGEKMSLIGWAADGFPIYARYGYSVANDSNSSIKVIKGSYQFKTVPSPNRPSASAYPLGTFTQDYEYVAGSGDLDECNGRTGVTPEFPAGTYHYFATDSYPYLQRCVKGKL